MKIEVCPCTLESGFESYSPVAIRNFADGKKVSHILNYDSFPAENETKLFDDNRERISLSGVQSKYSVVIDNGEFRLTRSGEQGRYILKPKLPRFENRDFSPANEHLTMQIASQVYKIETAKSALCFSKNGEAAYLCKRYDVQKNEEKIQQEDFASLAGLSAATHGGNYKYDALSYEDIGLLIQKFLPAWKIEVVKYFEQVLFNFVFGNGDAHVKNFSVIKTNFGDYRLAPAYDLINTTIHLPGDSIFALSKGLYNGWNPNHYITGIDFLILAQRIGISEAVAEKKLEKFSRTYPLTDKLVKNSFLSEKIKEDYLRFYKTRINSFLKVR